MTAASSATRTAVPEDDANVADRIDVVNPATGRSVGSVPVMTAAEVAELAGRLRAAQPRWEALGPKRRAKYLLEWLNWLMDNDTRLLGLVQQETGKSWGDASIESMVAVEVINYFAKRGATFLADERRRPHGPASLTKRLELYRRPYQLVGIITPWNYPVSGSPSSGRGASTPCGRAARSCRSARS